MSIYILHVTEMQDHHDRELSGVGTTNRISIVIDWDVVGVVRYFEKEKEINKEH